MKITILILALVMLVGCATPPPEKVAALDYGELPADWQQLTIDSYKRTLKDPDSAKFYFERAPFKGYTRKFPFAGGGIDKAGWVIQFELNAKNSFGGYVGPQYYRVLYCPSENRFYPIMRNNHFKEEWLR